MVLQPARRPALVARRQQRCSHRLKSEKRLPCHGLTAMRHSCAAAAQPRRSYSPEPRLTRHSNRPARTPAPSTATIGLPAMMCSVDAVHTAPRHQAHHHLFAWTTLHSNAARVAAARPARLLLCGWCGRMASGGCCTGSLAAWPAVGLAGQNDGGHWIVDSGLLQRMFVRHHGWGWQTQTGQHSSRQMRAAA